MTMVIRKVEAAVPYSNPGSRNSKLGGRVAAKYGVFVSDELVAEIIHVVYGWVIQEPVEPWRMIGNRTYMALAEAKGAARKRWA